MIVLYARDFSCNPISYTILWLMEIKVYSWLTTKLQLAILCHFFSVSQGFNLGDFQTPCTDTPIIFSVTIPRPSNRPGFSGTIPEIYIYKPCPGIPNFCSKIPDFDGPGYGVKYLCATRKRDRPDRMNCV